MANAYENAEAMALRDWNGKTTAEKLEVLVDEGLSKWQWIDIQAERILHEAEEEMGTR